MMETILPSSYPEISPLSNNQFKLMIECFENNKISGEKYDRENSLTLSPIKEIKALENIYIFRNPFQIEYYLFNKNEVIPILKEIYRHIVERFGASPVYLELDNDPEEEYEGLFVEIDSLLSIDDTMTNLDKIIDWFIKSVPDNIREYLTITLK